MDFRQGSKISLLTQLNAMYTLVIGNVALWQFSDPVALTGDASGMDTKIKLTALDGNTTYSGNRTFKYNRLSLATLKSNYPTRPTLPLSGVARVYDCLPYLLKTTGILFSQADLEDADVVVGQDGLITIPLTAKATSILWSGSTQIVSGGLPHISLAITRPYFDWS